MYSTSAVLQVLTALPMLAVASIARSTRVLLVLRANDLVMCDTNSTEIPTACTQYTQYVTYSIVYLLYLECSTVIEMIAPP